ncbi:MAG: histidine phosphatase family protein [Marmoricola sp.]
MGQVLLVRHGQASFGSEDYDVLSAVGEQQSAVLGRFLSGLDPQSVVHGSLQRQRRTAEIAVEAAGWSATPYVDPRWDEMDHLLLLAAHPQPSVSEPDARQFQAWFEAATDRWTSGGHDHDYDESFPDFTARVRGALDDLHPDGTTVVFTSGGPIATVVTQLLDAGTPTYTRLAPVVVNSSITRIVTGRRGRTLVSFNAHAHLQDRPDLLTYR